MAETRIRSKFWSETCKSQLLSGGRARVDNTELEKARANDRKLGHAARQHGNTHVVACKPVHRYQDVSESTVYSVADPLLFPNIVPMYRLKRKTPTAVLRPAIRVRAKTSPMEVLCTKGFKRQRNFILLFRSK